MVIVMKPGVSQEKIQALVAALERDQGVKVGITNGVGCSILGLVEIGRASCRERV